MREEALKKKKYIQMFWLWANLTKLIYLLGSKHHQIDDIAGRINIYGHQINKSIERVIS